MNLLDLTLLKALSRLKYISYNGVQLAVKLDAASRIDLDPPAGSKMWIYKCGNFWFFFTTTRLTKRLEEPKLCARPSSPQLIGLL